MAVFEYSSVFTLEIQHHCMLVDKQISLLQRFFSGSITDRKLKKLFLWLNSEKGNLEYEEFLDKSWASNDFELLEAIDSSVLFSKIEAKVKKRQLSGKKHFLIRLRNVAAIFILGFMIPVVYYSVVSSSRGKELVYYKESLSNEKVRKLMLPDGTTVWLMSGSTIGYPSDFSACDTRNVEVTGEAFFNVAKDTTHPFILTLGDVGIKVTGTSFNVINYKDEDHVQVVLKSGKVDLFKGKYDPDKQLVHISPGQLATYVKGGSNFSVTNADVSKYTSWTDGILLFRNDPLAEVLKKLGRWYNITVKINDPSASNFPFTATIKNENIEQIIDLLQYSTPFKYSISKVDGTTQLVIDKKQNIKPEKNDMPMK
jgi:transmembrane sensor